MWNVSPGVNGVRERMHVKVIPDDTWIALSAAESFVDQFRVSANVALLDGALVSLAHVLKRDASSEGVRALAMWLLLSPPLATPSAFERLCVSLQSVPAGRGA